jgi:hypothetical protein
MSICPTGGRTKAANDNTTSKSNNDAIGKPILNTAARNFRVLIMVNEDSYWSVSGGCSAHSRGKPSNAKGAAGAVAAQVGALEPEGDVELSFGLQPDPSRTVSLTIVYRRETY